MAKYWIGSICTQGKSRVFLDDAKRLTSAKRDTEILFGKVDWIFADFETHERLNLLEGSTTTYDESGEPSESYITLVRAEL